MPMVLVLEERGEKAGGPPTTPFQPTTTIKCEGCWIECCYGRAA